jgi:hypothetical protein
LQGQLRRNDGERHCAGQYATGEHDPLDVAAYEVHEYFLVKMDQWVQISECNFAHG